MLDEFLEVVYAQNQKRDMRQQMVDAFMNFPEQELHKIASGRVKLANYDEDEWLDKFEGTPLHDQALALEEEKLQLDIQESQQDFKDTAERRAEGDASRSIRDAKDALRLKRRLLELELRKGQLGSMQGEEPAPVPSDAPPAALLPEPEKMAAVDFLYAQRMGAIRSLGEMMKAAAEEKTKGASTAPVRDLGIVAGTVGAGDSSKLASSMHRSMLRIAHSALEKCASDQLNTLDEYEVYSIAEMAKAAEARIQAGVAIEDLEDFEKLAIWGAIKAGLGGAGAFLGKAGKAIGSSASRASSAAGGGLSGAKAGLTAGASRAKDWADIGLGKATQWGAANPGAAAALGAGALTGAAGLGYAAGR